MIIHSIANSYFPCSKRRQLFRCVTRRIVCSEQDWGLHSIGRPAQLGQWPICLALSDPIWSNFYHVFIWMLRLQTFSSFNRLCLEMQYPPPVLQKLFCWRMKKRGSPPRRMTFWSMASPHYQLCQFYPAARPWRQTKVSNVLDQAEIILKNEICSIYRHTILGTSWHTILFWLKV